MTWRTSSRRSLSTVALACGVSIAGWGAGQSKGSYQDLLALSAQWQTFERPPVRSGAPDYTDGTVARRQQELVAHQARLTAIDPTGWPIGQQVDHALLRAQMDGLDFDIRVLRPWARDPAFYKSIWTEQSDTPAHEGPTHHAVVELWTYTFPLTPASEARLATGLAAIPPLLAQARTNLTGNARDLWATGIGTMKEQAADLADLGKQTSQAGPELKRAIAAAGAATNEFVGWLEQQAPSKTGPSGVGKESYTWNLQRVHLVPLTWDDEVMLLKRELARAHASLRLEEQRNRGLPPLTAAASPEEYARRANEAVTKYLAWLRGRDVLTVQDYLDPALRRHVGAYVPVERRNFFAIASHYEPMTLYAHFFHWFDHAWMEFAPHASPIRRGALSSNLWDSRSEGMATAMEGSSFTPGTTTTTRARGKSRGSCWHSGARAAWPHSTRRRISSTSRRRRRSRWSGRPAAGCAPISTCSISSSSCTCGNRATARATSPVST
jgi:hypothetical protein